MRIEQIEAECRKLAAKQYGVISRSQAVSLGMPGRAIRHRVGTSRWKEIFPYVYVIDGSPPTSHQGLMAAQLWSGGPVSHRAAAALWGFPEFTLMVYDVYCSSRKRSPSQRIVCHYSTESLPTRSVDGIMVTSPERTLLDIGCSVPEWLLAGAVEDALRRRLTSIRRLIECIDRSRGSGKRGTGQLRRVIAERGLAPATESPLEDRIERLLKRAGFPTPLRQFEIRNGDRLIARVDFAYPEQRLAIEVDGFRYHSGRQRFDAERERLNSIKAAGWDVLIATAATLRRPARDRFVEAVGLFFSPQRLL